LALIAAPLWGQQDVAPVEGDASSARFRIGIYGFGLRAGVEVQGGGQAIAGATLDLGDLYGDRLRLRPSVELGYGSDANTYVTSVEGVFRFLGDTEVAVPYLGSGVGLFVQDNCEMAPNCPKLWLQSMLGLEIRFRPALSWLVEYHAENAFNRHRLLVGLTTRRGF
jgi:hypothetical protein